MSRKIRRAISVRLTYVEMRRSARTIIGLLLMLRGAGGYTFDVPHDGVPREMWCNCAEYECNCAYRLTCEAPPTTVVQWGWTSDVEVNTCPSAKYSGKCYCTKSCLCDTEEFGAVRPHLHR